VANRKKSGQDFNTSALAAVLEITDSGPVKGEDLIGDPKLRKAFKDAKRRARAKKDSR
jgi:hypothetical protein